jgi:hypothetical protein
MQQHDALATATAHTSLTHSTQPTHYLHRHTPLTTPPLPCTLQSECCSRGFQAKGFSSCSLAKGTKASTTPIVRTAALGVCFRPSVPTPYSMCDKGNCVGAGETLGSASSCLGASRLHGTAASWTSSDVLPLLLPGL